MPPAEKLGQPSPTGFDSGLHRLPQRLNDLFAGMSKAPRFACRGCSNLTSLQEHRTRHEPKGLSVEKPSLDRPDIWPIYIYIVIRIPM